MTTAAILMDTDNGNKPIVCRMCLSTVNGESFYQLFKSITAQETIADIVAIHFLSIQPTIDDIYTKHICVACWQYIETFHSFYLKVCRAQNSLSEHTEVVYATSIKVEDTIEKQSETKTESSNGCENDVSVLMATLNNQESEVDIDESSQDEFGNSLDGSEDPDNEEIETVTKLQKGKIKNIDKPMMMPRNFNEQVRTDDIFKRFKQIRPILANDTDTSFTCNLCGKIFEKRVSANGHLRRNHRLPFVCPEGDARFHSIHQILTHIKKEHTSIVVHESTVCSVCGKVLGSVGAMKYHIESVHLPVDQPKVQCKECGVWLKDQTILKIHRQQQHVSDRTPIKCDLCSQTLCSAKNLAMHKRRYHDKTFIMHKCKICDKSFHVKQRLKEHVSAVHLGQAIYKCDFCPKTFNVRPNFYTHRRRMHPEEYQKIVHDRQTQRLIEDSDEKMDNVPFDDTKSKYKCKTCEKDFQLKLELKEHHFSEHTDKEPGVKCDVCIGKFHILEYYHKHMRETHPKEYKLWKKETIKKKSAKKNNKDEANL